MQLVSLLYQLAFWSAATVVAAMIVSSWFHRSEDDQENLELTLSATGFIAEAVLAVVGLVVTARLETVAVVIGGAFLGALSPILLNAIGGFLRKEIPRLWYGPRTGDSGAA